LVDFNVYKRNDLTKQKKMKKLRCKLVPVGLGPMFTKGSEYEFFMCSSGDTPTWSIKGDIGVWYDTDSISLHFDIIEIPADEVSIGDRLNALELELSIIKTRIKDLIK